MNINIAIIQYIVKTNTIIFCRA